MKRKIYTLNISNFWLAAIIICLSLGHLPTISAQEPIFGNPVQNPFGLFAEDTLATLVKLVDIDLDDTLEAFVTVQGIAPGQVHYYENEGSNAAPDFVFQETDPFGLAYDRRRPWQFVDIDGDGLPELFMGGFDSNCAVHMIDITMNNGVPDLSGDTVVNPFGIRLPVSPADGGLLDAGIPNFVDIDADGDYDLFFSGYFDNDLNDEALFFMENKDTSGNGTSPQFDSIETNPFGFDIPLGNRAHLLIFADLNCDTKQDMYISTLPGNQIGYILNQGTTEDPDFSGGATSNYGTPFSPPGGTFLDIGNDGDLDLLNGSPNSGIQFYENLDVDLDPEKCITSVREKKLNTRVFLAPNPVGDLLQVSIEPQQSLKNPNLEIFNLLGEHFLSEELGAVGPELTKSLDISHLPAGIYFLKITQGDRALARRFVKL